MVESTAKRETSTLAGADLGSAGKPCTGDSYEFITLQKFPKTLADPRGDLHPKLPVQRAHRGKEETSMNGLSSHFFGCSARGGRRLSRHALLALLLAAAAISGCGGGSDSNPNAPRPSGPPATPVAEQTPPVTGTGTLTVAVTDVEGRPLVDAYVNVFNRNQTATVGSWQTGSNGTVSIGSLPTAVRVYVHHDFGVSASYNDVAVAPQGNTLLSVIMQADRSRPTVALLPVSIKPGSVSDDRSELTLEVTLVASSAAPFTPAGYGDYSPESTPALGLALGQWDKDGQRQCFVWLDRKRTEPSCGAPWGSESSYTVSVERFTYDRNGTVPRLGTQGPASSALLLMDQSRRVAELDPDARRSFALRHFFERAIDRAQPESLSLAGFAGTDNSTSSGLPSQPLWLPLGEGSAFSTDGAVLKSGVGMLEPYVGGTAPVFESLQAAINVAAASAPSGNRAIVAMLGGGDDRDMSDAARRSALAALRQQRDATGVQSVLIVGAPTWSTERLAVADLAAALHAPAISLGLSHIPLGFERRLWAAGSFAAFDLAADLIGGLPLPTLSAAFRVKAKSPTTFSAGTTLYGVVYVESDSCPMGCAEVPLEFAVEIP
jgi:hypothetical protein